MAQFEREVRHRFLEKDEAAIEYKNISLLQKLCTPQGKLYDRTRLGTTARQQRKIARAVKRARFIGLLRYVGGR